LIIFDEKEIVNQKTNFWRICPKTILLFLNFGCLNGAISSPVDDKWIKNGTAFFRCHAVYDSDSIGTQEP